MELSIIIPAYNEEKIINETVIILNNYLKNVNINYEIIVVNDGSTDNTKKILQKIHNIKLINHPYNKGYGASLKTGVNNAQFDWVLFYDGDGQHKPEYISELLKYTNEYDMIIGSREGYKGPWIRQPGKIFLKSLASYLVGLRIPDLNSGFRLVNKKLFYRFYNLYPNNFSLTTTITLASIKEAYSLKYIPIIIEKRTGKSSVKPRHALDTFLLITRIIILFSPMRIFLPASLITGLLATSFLVYDLIGDNISDVTVFLSISTVLLFFFGLILDQLSAMRRDLNK